MATVPLQIDDANRGTFRGETPPLDIGQYDVRIRASGYDAAALRATTPIWVVDRPSIESHRVSRDAGTLREIATAGDGVSLDESSAADVLAEIIPTSRGQILRTDTPLYPSGWLFLVVLALLASEWALRKKVGLA